MNNRKWNRLELWWHEAPTYKKHFTMMVVLVAWAVITIIGAAIAVNREDHRLIQTDFARHVSWIEVTNPE